MHTPNLKRIVGNAICIVALAMVANLTVGPETFSGSERKLEWALAGASLGVGVPISVSARRQRSGRMRSH